MTPDIGGILKDPGKAVEAIKEIGKQFKEGGNAKDIGDAVKGAIGKDGGKKLLEGLFR